MIFVTTPEDHINLNKLSGSKWIYIGNYHDFDRVAKIMKKNNRMFIGRDTESIVDSVRQNFVDYVAQVSQLQKNQVLWYTSRLASKSMSQTSIFQQYVYQKLLEKLAQDKKNDILIISGDLEFLHNVKKIKPDGVAVLRMPILNRKALLEKFYGCAGAARYILYWFVWCSLRNRNLRDFDVFMHTWIDKRLFTKLPELRDEYFGSLQNFLKEKGFRVARLTPLIFPLRYLRALRKNFSNIVYPLSYLKLCDLLKCIFTRFDVALDKNVLRDIKDIEILDALTRNEVGKENRSKAYLSYLLLYYSYKNLATMIEGNVSFIYPFENQPWEKVFNLAFPEFNKVAYQHSTIPINWLDYLTSPYDNGVPQPKIILAMGKKWVSFLKKYYRDTIIEDAGAIRFSYLFDSNRRREHSRSLHPKTIVVALPISSSISISLQRRMLNALESMELSGYSVKIKPHPYLPDFARMEGEFSKYKNCRFTTSSITDLFKESNLVITSGSTVALESVLMGIKTLYLIPEEVSLGVEYFFRDHIFIGYEENFSGRLKEALENTGRPEVDIKEYFSHPDYSQFLKYLRIKAI